MTVSAQNTSVPTTSTRQAQFYRRISARTERPTASKFGTVSHAEDGVFLGGALVAVW